MNKNMEDLKMSKALQLIVLNVLNSMQEKKSAISHHQMKTSQIKLLACGRNLNGNSLCNNLNDDNLC